MPKTLNEKIQEIDQKILELTENKKQLLQLKKEKDKKEKEKLLNQIGELMASKGFKTIDEVKQFLTQNIKGQEEAPK